MRVQANKLVGGLVGTALVLAACTGGESARSPSQSQSNAGQSGGQSSAFSNPAEITNQYVPLGKGGRWIYEGKQSGKPQLIEIAVTPATRTIDWNGDPIESVVVRRRGWVDGILKQESHDYYAQKDDGSVWAMGEQVDNFKAEKLFDHSGSWLAGADGATPGLVMPANPQVKSASITEDVIGLVDAGSYEVLSLTESVTTPAGQVDNGLLLGATQANPAAESLFVPQIGAVLARSGSNEVSLTDRLPHNAESASATKFSDPTIVVNPYFGVTGVDYRLYLGKEEGEPLRIEVAPTGKNKTLKWKGGETSAAISQFTATSDRSLLEIAVDWFAQDDAGNVWYFGEDVWNYEKGRIANTDGSWTAGVDGPPGMIMPGEPSVGRRFNPENIPGNVFETVDVKTIDASYKLTNGKRLNGVVELHETLSDGMEEFKLYARGYGNVYVEVPGAREIVDIVYALPNDAIDASRPGELNAALNELRAMSLRGTGDMNVVRNSVAKLAGRGDPIPSVLTKLGRTQLGALDRAITGSEEAKVRMSALDLEQTMLDVARLYRGRSSVELELIDLYARRMLAAIQSGDRATAGTAAALAHGVALRNVTTIQDKVMKASATADSAADRGSYSAMTRAANRLRAAL